MIQLYSLVNVAVAILPPSPHSPFPILTLSSSRVAFTTILDTVRSIPFPIPRAFFRTGGGPRVFVAALPPMPPAAAAAADAETAAGQQHDDLAKAQGSNNHLAKRPKRNVGYYGPSCKQRAENAENDRLLRRPVLPLMGPRRDGAAGPLPGRGDSVADSRRARGRGAWLPSELWWTKVVKHEATGWVAGAWRVHGYPVSSAGGVWLVQGSVCRGSGAGGALPPVSEVRRLM